MRWPSKVFAVGRRRQIVYNEDNLVVGYNMKPRGNALIDVSPNGNNGTLVSSPSVEKTILGDSMYLDGVDDYISCGTPYSLTNLTISFWINPSDVTNSTYPINYYLNNNDAWGFRIFSGFIAISDDIDNAGAFLYSTAIATNQWYNITAVMSGLENLLYVNGVLVGSGTSSSDYWSSFAGTLYLGSRSGAANFYNGRILAPKLYSEAKDATWVAEQYELGARAVQGKTDWGAQESVAAEATAGEFLSNTPVVVTNGSWRLVTDTIGVDTCKAIKCITSARRVYIPSTLFKGTPTEDAFGSWEFWVKKVEDAGAIIVQVISAVGGAGSGSNNNYNFMFDTDETVSFRRRAVDLIAPATVYNLNRWYKVRITRDHVGVFRLYMDDVLVGTSAADLTYTTSSAITIELGANDLFAYSDLRGYHCLVKYSGVVTP